MGDIGSFLSLVYTPGIYICVDICYENEQKKPRPKRRGGRRTLEKLIVRRYAPLCSDRLRTHHCLYQQHKAARLGADSLLQPLCRLLKMLQYPLQCFLSVELVELIEKHLF